MDDDAGYRMKRIREMLDQPSTEQRPVKGAHDYCQRFNMIYEVSENSIWVAGFNNRLFRKESDDDVDVQEIMENYDTSLEGELFDDQTLFGLLRESDATDFSDRHEQNPQLEDLEGEFVDDVERTIVQGGSIDSVKDLADNPALLFDGLVRQAITLVYRDEAAKLKDKLERLQEFIDAARYVEEESDDEELTELNSWYNNSVPYFPKIDRLNEACLDVIQNITESVPGESDVVNLTKDNSKDLAQWASKLQSELEVVEGNYVYTI